MSAVKLYLDGVKAIFSEDVSDHVVDEVELADHHTKVQQVTNHKPEEVEALAVSAL